jgi:hypothetical protein
LVRSSLYNTAGAANCVSPTHINGSFHMRDAVLLVAQVVTE